MNIKLRKTIQLFSYYLIPITIFLYIIINLYLGNHIKSDIVELGEYAFKLVLFIVIIKPLHTITKLNFLKKALTYRQELGVLSFYFAIFHGFGLIYYSSLFSIQGLLKLINPKYALLFTGFLALIGMIILGLTSNKISMLKLKKNWKKIQMLTYPTFALICIHKAIAEDEFGPYVILSIYTILKITQIIIQKRNK